MASASRGLVAGVVATMVLAILMIVVNAAGVVPRMNTIRLLTAAADGLFDTGSSFWVGWALFFFVGAVWGLIFAWIFHRIAGGRAWVRGVVFGAGAWLVMMVVFMPVADAGWFGLALGAGAPVVTLVGHLVFGAVMGVCFAALPARPRPAGTGTTGKRS